MAQSSYRPDPDRGWGPWAFGLPPRLDADPTP